MPSSEHVEGVGFLEAANEAGGEGGGVADVGERDGFHGGMHITKRDGNEPAGNAVAGCVDDVRVGAGAAGDGLVLNWDFEFFGNILFLTLYQYYLRHLFINTNKSFIIYL